MMPGSAETEAGVTRCVGMTKLATSIKAAKTPRKLGYFFNIIPPEFFKPGTLFREPPAIISTSCAGIFLGITLKCYPAGNLKPACHGCPTCVGTFAPGPGLKINIASAELTACPGFYHAHHLL